MGYVFFIGSSRPVVRVLVPIGCITKNSTWGHAMFASRSVPRPALAFPSHVPATSPPRTRRSEPTRPRRRRRHGASHPKTNTIPHFSRRTKRGTPPHTGPSISRPDVPQHVPTSPLRPHHVPGEVSQHADDDVVPTARRTPKQTQTLTSPRKETERNGVIRTLWTPRKETERTRHNSADQKDGPRQYTGAHPFRGRDDGAIPCSNG